MNLNPVNSKLIIVAGAISFLSACGGGGGGADTSSISFPSSATMAEPTIENGEKVEEVVTKDPQDIAYSLNSVEASTNHNIILTLNNVQQKTVQKLPRRKTAGQYWVC